MARPHLKKRSWHKDKGHQKVGGSHTHPNVMGSGRSIYQQLKQAGVELDSHESDLYEKG